MIPWISKGGTPNSFYTLQFKINALIPAIVETFSAAAESPSLQRHIRESFLFTPEEVRTFILGDGTFKSPKVTFRMKLRTTRRSHNIATAFHKDRSVRFNPHWLEDVDKTLSPGDFKIIVTDMILHEIAHLLTDEFCQDRGGHGPGWKAWARAAGFVPYGSASNHKRLFLARQIQGKGPSLRKVAGTSSPRKTLRKGLIVPVTILDAPEIIPAESKSPADLARKLILSGASNPEVTSEVRRAYPNYGAWKICASVYRRELRKKGQI